MNFFEAGAGLDDLRVVIPYADDGNLFSDTSRILAVLDEVPSCAGGDPMRVHLAGISNGGVAAFGLMSTQPERFATLLGAPGLFRGHDPADIDPQLIAQTFAGRAVFNGVGELDANWQPGVESVFVEFPGQGHIPQAGFDGSALIDFWRSH